ncbi:S9 family peptidase [Caulobacter sp. S45]|uniref:S9 family peptidase n=1 Tax=Caulobacter sp. S45 TaxID=1641861 RepID=UPI00131DF569|nr:S9 family peptidase [Caulobacter sp. S45]
MKASLLAALAAGLPVLAFAAEPPPQGALTPERVFSSPSLSGPSARGVEVSPDGRWVTYLKAETTNQNKLDLWAAPVAGGQARLLVSGQTLEPPGQQLTEVEKNRRERQRVAALSGVIDYRWDEQGKRILIPAGGDLYTADAVSGQVVKLDAGGSGISDAKVSPLGRYASYVRDQNLYVIDFADGHERAITTAGQGPVSYGLAEFVAQEEMDRYTGYWWAPGDKAIAYARVDEGPVDILPRLEIGVEGSKITQQRYPKAGRPNVGIELYIQAPEAGAKPVKVDLGADPDIYLARVNWSADGRDLYVQRETRDQKTLDLLRIDPATGAAKTILTERQTPWINLNDDFYALKDGDFIWGSERTGANHLYLYHRDGTLVHAITHGDWPVTGAASGAGAHATGVAGVDEAKGLVYFLASKDTPVERQLYVVSYRTPGEPQAVTHGHGWWTATMPKSAKAFVGYYSDPLTPPQTALYAPDGRRLSWIEQNALDAGHPFFAYARRYPEPEFGVLKSEDGQDLHYILQKPAGFDPARKYPAIVQVYGGPGVQQVQRAWRPPNEKLLLEAGYVLFQLDNRGSANRDMKFEGAIANRLGSVEVDDQLVGLEHLRSLPFVQADRVGVMGWSYGGYMTLRLLTDPRTHFRAGASGAPPTDWREYDTHYTERYMGMPQTNAAAYDASAVVPRLGDLSGRLLLLQGMADDNVQFSNSIAVMAKLQGLGTPFDLMLYPGQRHHIDDDHRPLQLWRTYLQFFARELGGR